MIKVTVNTRDSVRAEFSYCQQAGDMRVGITREIQGGTLPCYLLKQDGKEVGRLLGKEMVCGGHHFAFIPTFDPDQELRLESLHGLIWHLSCGVKIEEAVAEAGYEDSLEWE